MSNKLKMVFKPNTLYHGDCLDVLKDWPAECVNLIYLDPPFNSNANYNLTFGKDQEGKKRDDMAQFTAFKDTWTWDADDAERVEYIMNAIGHPAHKAISGLYMILGESGMMSYLVYMAERLTELKRVLKDTGSIYLHCDQTASHYLKTIMECVFGVKNFRNDIVWCYGSPGDPNHHFPRKHDMILFYARGDNNTFNKEEVRIAHKRIDKRTVKEGWRRDAPLEYTPEKAKELAKGKLPFSWWDKFAPAYKSAKQYLGYPTQKPLGLLNRIIKASSNPGDIVLDPFCGCGTTAKSAYDNKRKFVGIDVSPYAINAVCKERLKSDFTVRIEGLPQDMESAKAFAEQNRFRFEQWAVTTLEGFEPNDNQVGDGGIDGRGLLYNKDKKGKKRYAVVQVKSGGFTPDSIRSLLSKITTKVADIGVFITMEKVGTRNRTMMDSIAKAGKLKEGTKSYNRLVFWSIEEHFAGLEPKLPAMAHPRTGKQLQNEMMFD